jgi:hypothetical protein
MADGERTRGRAMRDAAGRESAPPLAPVFAVLVVEGDNARRATGHSLQHAVTGLVQDLRKRLARMAQDVPAVYGPGAGARTVLRVVATAAGGEPGLAARIAAALGFPLHRVSVDPAVPDLFATDERSVLVGDDPATAAATSGVTLVQEAALAFSDLLLMTWDGRSLGPHTHLMREAAVCGKAILWIDLGGEARLLEGSRLNEVTRHLLRAGHPTAEMLAEMFSPVTQPVLNEAMAQVANPRAGHARDHFGASLGRYFTEPPPHSLASRLSGRLHSLVGRLLTSSRNAPPPHDPPHTPGDEAGVVPASLQARKRWSSRQASHAAGAVRDAGWVLWLFSPLAVFAAAAGAIELWTDPGSQAWVAVELAALALITLLVLFAKRRDWHGQWLQHRFVAEQLRYQALAYPLLTFLPVFTRAIPLRPESWLLRRSLVAAGLPMGAEGGAFVADERLSERRGHVLAAIHGQIAYHAAKHHGLELMEKRLERFATGAFVLTALAASTHLFAHWSWVVLFTTTLPAMAAAAHGILSSLEVKRLASQSRTAQARLESLGDALEGVQLEAPDAWPRVRYLVEQAVRTMSDDAEQWRELVDHHAVDLPA